MAITNPSTGVIQIDSGKLDGTATGGSTTTLVVSSATWTTNQWAGYSVWNKVTKESRRIESNTGTTLTIYSDNPWTAPVNTNTYSIAYNEADIQAANDAGSWGICTTRSRGVGIFINATLLLVSGAYFAPTLNSQIEVVGTATRNSAVRVKSGARYHQGRLYINANGDIFGVNGGQMFLGGLFAYDSYVTTWGTDIGDILLHGIVVEGWNKTAQGSWRLSCDGYGPDVMELVDITSPSQISCSAANSGNAGAYSLIKRVSCFAAHSPVTIRNGNASVVYSAIDNGITTSVRFLILNNPSTLTAQTVDDWYTKRQYLMGNIAGANGTATQLTHKLRNARSGASVDNECYSYSGTQSATDPKLALTTHWMPYPRYNQTLVTGGTWSIIDKDATLVYSGSMDGATYQEVQWRIHSPVVGGTTYTHVDTTPYSINIFRYGYFLQSFSRTLKYATTFSNDSAITKYGESFNLALNPFVVETESNAWAYSGITLDGEDKTIAVSGTRTIQELYDYTQAWLNQSTNVQYGEALRTSDGINFALGSGWSISVTGSLTSTTQKFTTKPTVASDGVFQDTDGVIREASGHTQYFSPVTFTFKDGATAKQYVECAVFDDTASNRTYDSTLTAAATLTSDGSGVVTGYVLYKVDATTYTGHYLKARLYGYDTYSVPKTVDGLTINTTEQLVADSFATTARATVGAYAGFALDYTAKTITTSTAHTIVQWYEFIKYSDALAANLAKDDTVSTDGTNYTLISTWSDIASGSLTDVTKLIVRTSGTVTVTGTGLYEDNSNVLLAVSGATHYLKHFHRNVKDVATSTDQRYAVVTAFAADGTELCYNTSFVLGGLTTDADGKSEGYYLWQIDATPYIVTEYIGLYGFLWATTPIPATGTPIGTTSTFETYRLTTDPNVTLTRTNALAVSGVTVDTAGKTVDMNANTLSETSDNLKARQTSVSEIEAGLKGYLSYYTDGLLLTQADTTFTGKSDWRYENSDDAGTFQTGTIVYGTPGVIGDTFGTATIDFSTAGTYDLRTAVFFGTTEFTNSSGGDVTLHVTPTLTYTDTGPDITYDKSVDTTIEVTGLVAGSRVRIMNVTDTDELYNDVVAGTSLSVNITWVTNKTIKVWATNLGYLPIEMVAVLSASGASFVATQEVDAVYVANGIDGSTVDEYSADYYTLQVDIDDPDGIGSIKRLYAWGRYNETTEDGIRYYIGLINAYDEINYWIDGSVIDLQMNNVGALPIVYQDAYLIKIGGTELIDTDTSKSIFFIPGRAYASTADVASIWGDTATYGAGTKGKLLVKASKPKISL